MEYVKVTGDKQYDPIMLKALGVASRGKQGSFLESESAPAWNDDILWWAMPSATGALIYGSDATFTDGLSMKQVTINTFNQVWKTWDDKCGGGLYWIRNQKNKAGYKSTITNVQQMLIGAQLTAITGDKSYVQKSDQILKWLKAQNLLTADGSIYDGIDGDDNCKIVKKRLTYNAGVILGALGWMYEVTNQQSYIDQSNIILDTTLRGTTENGIFYEPCEIDDICPLNTAPYKAALMSGLGFLYEHTPDEGQKKKIRDSLTTSAQAMVKVCENDWNCGTNWLKGKKTKSVHDQMSAIELMTAYYKTFEKESNLAKPAKADTMEAIVSTVPNSGLSTSSTSQGPRNNSSSVTAIQKSSSALSSMKPALLLLNTLMALSFIA